MNFSNYLAIVSLSFLSLTAAAETLPDASTHFGAQDSRGAFQEIEILPISVTLEYFEDIVRDRIQSGVETQKKYGIWHAGPSPLDYWGHPGQVFFQEGKLVSRNAKSMNYPLLDLSLPYAVANATVSFDSPAQADTGNFRIDGVVTLVTGSAAYGPVSGKGEALPGFQQSVILGYIHSGAYHHDGKSGGQFNEWGNGKNDHGRIHHFGMISPFTGPLTLEAVQRAVGSLARIHYP